MVVTYFDNNDNLLPSPLPNPYINTIPHEEIITVRVAKENSPNCFNEVSFKLTINICEELNVDFPHFFTPNNDGINDIWPKNTNLKSITIYDRFGKILKILSPNEAGWDGTYNGSFSPSTDYWFNAVISDDKTIKGHFSLIR